MVVLVLCAVGSFPSPDWQFCRGPDPRRLPLSGFWEGWANQRPWWEMEVGLKEDHSLSVCRSSCTSPMALAPTGVPSPWAPFTSPSCPSSLSVVVASCSSWLWAALPPLGTSHRLCTQFPPLNFLCCKYIGLSVLQVGLYLELQYFHM